MRCWVFTLGCAHTGTPAQGLCWTHPLPGSHQSGSLGRAWPLVHGELTLHLIRADKEGKPPSKEKKKKSREVHTLPEPSWGAAGQRGPQGGPCSPSPRLTLHPPLQEEEKAAKKKSRRKKSRDQAEDKGREERRRRRGPERTAVHELEAFLGGGAPGGHLRGGGDYEEL